MFIAEKSCPEVNVTPSRSSRHQSIVAFHLKCARCALGDATKNMLDAARIGRQTALSDHLKTGQRRSGQNRPTKEAGTELFYSAESFGGKLVFVRQLRGPHLSTCP